MIPGEMLVADGEIELNVGRSTIRVTVANTGDRPIQVGSHYHFAETNAALRFDRAAARGYRLNIAAGTAVRFEPGQEREVELVALDGARMVYGFTGEVMGPLDAKPRASGRGKQAPRKRALKRSTKRTAERKTGSKTKRTAVPAAISSRIPLARFLSNFSASLVSKKW